MNKIVVYATNYCPFCRKAEKMLEAKGLEFELVDITENEEKERAILAEMTGGHRTVPQIFVGKTHVGGSEALEEAIKSGKLDELLNS